MNEKISIMERIDRVISSDCETCRIWRVGIFIGFALCAIINIGLHL